MAAEPIQATVWPRINPGKDPGVSIAVPNIGANAGWTGNDRSRASEIVCVRTAPETTVRLYRTYVRILQRETFQPDIWRHSVLLVRRALTCDLIQKV